MASAAFNLTEWRANFLDLLIGWQAEEQDFEVIFLSFYVHDFEREGGKYEFIVAFFPRQSKCLFLV